ncbi:MAG: ribulose-phosphate 3-epimerase [Acidobacteria bacterium]|nr:MAG: ribulose-phosphate 3-epimerase [Acidobacteriota bacterium]
MIEIAPSILSADFARLADELQRIEQGGADVVHVDVMDGHFVPNLTIGPPVVRALRAATELPLDCHLMIEHPEAWIARYAEAGAHRITIHAEATVHLHRALGAIREAGAEAGVAINPATPLEAVGEVLDEADWVLVMSVNPGFGGQSFIERATARIARLAERIAAQGSATRIQVDGGIGPDNAEAVVRAGARSLVAGNAVFGRPDAAQAVRELRAAAQRGLA